MRRVPIYGRRLCAGCCNLRSSTPAAALVARCPLASAASSPAAAGRQSDHQFVAVVGGDHESTGEEPLLEATIVLLVGVVRRIRIVANGGVEARGEVDCQRLHLLRAVPYEGLYSSEELFLRLAAATCIGFPSRGRRGRLPLATTLVALRSPSPPHWGGAEGARGARGYEDKRRWRPKRRPLMQLLEASLGLASALIIKRAEGILQGQANNECGILRPRLCQGPPTACEAV
mmetsp:Transcript_16286/g.36760  ORF Transcript_16286/g.36760 Transcript_16286/m.36760 type:complete len:231 (+) Transcript_16286:411-1103(+)